MVEYGRVARRGRIRASIENLSRRIPEKGSNQCEYRKMSESGRVPEKDRIRVNIEKLSRWVPEKGLFSVSTEKW